MQNTEEPDAEPGAACRTPCCQLFGGSADFEVNLLALKEETDGIFLSYTVVQCTPSVCDALAKSRNEFYQAPQSHKVVLQRLPLKQEPTQDLLYSYSLYSALQLQIHSTDSVQLKTLVC
jgi:hypothetical protein